MGKDSRRRLEALTAAYEELWSPQEEAEERAVRQLCAEAAVSPAPKQPGGDALRAIRRSNRVALATFGAATLLSFAAVLASGGLINFSFGAWLLTLILVWTPLVAGAAVGVIAPERPARAILLALGLLALPTLALYVVWALAQTFTSPWAAAIFFASLHLLTWVSLGAAAAGAIGAVKAWWRRRRAKRLAL